MQKFKRACELPAEWDNLCADNYSLKRDFLSLMEKVNPCKQRYYCFFHQNILDSILMLSEYQHFNIAMFTPIPFRVRVNLVYIPLSLAKAGFVMGKKSREELRQFLLSLKGYTLILNAKKDLTFPHMAKGLTCSNVKLHLKTDNFRNYLASLRSPYRRRFKLALAKGRKLSFRKLCSTSDFSHKMYNLYEQVYTHSRIQVEKLSLDYFRSIPASIIVAEYQGWPVGFLQLFEREKELVFAFVGFDYSLNQELDLYINLLLKIIDYALEKGYHNIDLGQTADEAKLRLGGTYYHQYVLISHSNPLINFCLKRLITLIDYKPLRKEFHVFKEPLP